MIIAVSPRVSFNPGVSFNSLSLATRPAAARKARRGNRCHLRRQSVPDWRWQAAPLCVRRYLPAYTASPLKHAATRPALLLTHFELDSPNQYSPLLGSHTVLDLQARPEHHDLGRSSRRTRSKPSTFCGRSHRWRGVSWRGTLSSPHISGERASLVDCPRAAALAASLIKQLRP